MEGPSAARFLWTMTVLSVLMKIVGMTAAFGIGVSGNNFYKCPLRCFCNAYCGMVNCANANYSNTVPELPNGTRKVILDGNSFRILTDGNLSRLAGVRNLSMRNCGIEGVDKNGMSFLSESLRVLRMSNNPLNKKRGAFTFLQHLRQLESLDLSGTGLKSYPKVLQDLPSLKQLVLAKNEIKAFPCNSIPPTLEYLNLGENSIGTIEFQRNRRKTGQSKNAKCQPKQRYRPTGLKTLILRINKIRELKSNSLRIFPNLESLDLSQNKLRSVHPLAFASDSLKAINLYYTQFRLHDDNWNIFHRAPNLEKINIGYCRIESGRNYTAAAFEKFNNLTALDISGTEISSLLDMFTNLKKLAKLRFSNNRISTLERSDFEGIADSLRELNLCSGRLSTITYESLPLKVWRNLQLVDFSDNRFLCDCNFVWLRSWLKKANTSGVRVGGWDKYYCQTSKGQVNMFQLETPSDAECFHDPLLEDPCLLISLLLASLIWITASATSALHRFRWHLRYWYFIRTVSSRKIADRHRVAEKPDIFSFDVFVGYSRSDSNWVINELLPRLEREYNLRVCIHERDWLAGRDIAENILESIDESRKTLLIVSNAFALSPWCHFELTMAQTRLMEEDRDSLVLILLEEIADCNLTPRLGIQMQRRTYIEWTKQSNVGRQLFWANLKHALARPSNSLMIESLSTQLFEYKEKHIG